MKATPMPVFARPRDSGFWQGHWQNRQPEGEFKGYAVATPLKKWFARQVVDLSPASVLELGCNVGGNLREIGEIDGRIALNGVELNEKAIAFGKGNVLPDNANFIHGSMADIASLFGGQVDVVFSSAAAMHCDDEIFARAKAAALSIARKAIVHLEFHAWTPADLSNGRQWRSSFFSDRWIRDYVGEYEGNPRVASIETRAIPMTINHMESIGRLKVNDVTGLIVVHLKP
jgi:SAM-dependent methyltransferase